MSEFAEPQLGPICPVPFRRLWAGEEALVRAFVTVSIAEEAGRYRPDWKGLAGYLNALALRLEDLKEDSFATRTIELHAEMTAEFGQDSRAFCKAAWRAYGPRGSLRPGLLRRRCW